MEHNEKDPKKMMSDHYQKTKSNLSKKEYPKLGHKIFTYLSCKIASENERWYLKNGQFIVQVRQVYKKNHIKYFRKKYSKYDRYLTSKTMHTTIT